MEEIVYKKYYRKADKHLNGKVKAHHGKRDHQKMKPYLVMQYLFNTTDENNGASAFNIEAFLADFGISAERRSIYRDIEDINKVMLALEEDCSIDEAAEMLQDDEYDELKTIVYDRHLQGFYVKKRKYELEDIRLLAECVYTAKFISEKQTQKLLDIICEFISEHQTSEILHDAFLVGRIKTKNEKVRDNIRTINDAMSYCIGEDERTPVKISFTYLTHTIDNVSNQTPRRKGERYIVSPYKLLIKDGNYYLLAFDDKKKKLWTYRVDRMDSVQYTQETREGEDEFKKIDLTTYTQKAFNMFTGEERLVTMRFINPLLDTVIERFSVKDAQYTKCDDKHFEVMSKVDVSSQFFGWLLGFGKKVKLVAPADVVESFKCYLEDVKKMY